MPYIWKPHLHLHLTMFTRVNVFTLGKKSVYQFASKWLTVFNMHFMFGHEDPKTKLYKPHPSHIRIPWARTKRSVYTDVRRHGTTPKNFVQQLDKRPKTNSQRIGSSMIISIMTACKTSTMFSSGQAWASLDHSILILCARFLHAHNRQTVTCVAQTGLPACRARSCPDELLDGHAGGFWGRVRKILMPFYWGTVLQGGSQEIEDSAW